MSKVLKFFRDESGISAAEYALILAIVCIGIVVVTGLLGDQMAIAMEWPANRIAK